MDTICVKEKKKWLIHFSSYFESNHAMTTNLCTIWDRKGDALLSKRCFFLSWYGFFVWKKMEKV